ncbi:hypothetical protein RND81_03G135400 [Saponaria officinalis]|uniref:C2 domain-containing protein n=1 Tax=Saponaria officinalis TaxID=3572 RepID=A0AAW1M8Q5_SAPOF
MNIEKHLNSTSSSSSMGKKLTVEVCLISARGLPRHRWLKHQYYAIGWINEDDKYCTSIDASSNPNPVWNTKFSSTVIDSDSQNMSVNLNVEVYSREPVFLRETLVGCASVSLREFLCKFGKGFEGRGDVNRADVGSFQLRKMKSCKPQGFIDVSVKVSEENNATASCSFLGDAEGFNLQDSNGITSTKMDSTVPPFHVSGNHHQPSSNPYAHPIPYPSNYWQPATGPSYPRPSTTPPPPPPPQLPPYAGGYGPSYMNMPSSSGAGRGGVPGLGVGLGVGAVAAGAVMYDGDFMSGFELPTVMPNPSLTIAIDPPF